MLETNSTVSNIERLLDELESFAEKSPWFMQHKIVIPDDRFFEIMQQVRELMPQEVSEAKKLLEKRDLILKNAQEEHKRIMETAEKRLEEMTSQHEVAVAAQHWAERHVGKARLEAQAVKRDALQYTIELMSDMEKQFTQTLATLQKGRAYLEAEINSAVAENEAADTAGEV
jgi:hypothetical protein